MTDLKVHLPKPCSEPWDRMTPQGCNRHCATCDKTIHDLSALTISEAEELLESQDEVCVRATIGKGGVVALAPLRSSNQRRMIAAVGASLTLATAACTTIPDPERPNRYAISGKLPVHQQPIVRSSDGRTWKAQVEWRSTSFVVPDLYPGTYSITYRDMCGSEVLTVEDIVIRDASVDVGRLAYGGCIIVGVMTPIKQDGRG